MGPSPEATNKAAFGRFHDAVNSGDLDVIAKVIDEFLEPGAVLHVPAPPGVTGPAALKRIWQVLLRAFPDVHVALEDLIADGDKIVARNTVTGTHQGEYRGVPPTGRPVRYDEIFILRFADGKVAEIWGVVDSAAQLRQLGLMPA